MLVMEYAEQYGCVGAVLASEPLPVGGEGLCGGVALWAWRVGMLVSG